jgi:hypothetical protein
VPDDWEPDFARMVKRASMAVTSCRISFSKKDICMAPFTGNGLSMASSWAHVIGDRRQLVYQMRIG